MPEAMDDAAPPPVEHVVGQFPGETVQAPRSVAERLFDLRVWEQGTAGGHFAA
jgi:hypothetical protein